MAVTFSKNSQNATARLKRIDIDWTSDSGGDASGTSTDHVSGFLAAVDFIPGSGGDQPSDEYDVTLSIGDEGIDLLGGAGTDLSNATAARKQPLASDGSTPFPQPIVGFPTLTVANAGNTKSGRVVLYILNR